MSLPPLLDLDLLRSFVSIAELRSFTRAAERQLRTQSTISLQIKRLEDQLGRRLLERGQGAVRLTPEGEVLLGYARPMLALNDAAVARLTEPEVEGIVRLGTPEDFATTHLPGVLARFARAYPKVALTVECDLTLTLLERYRRSEFDLVLIKREPGHADAGLPVWREQLVWAGLDDGLADPVRLVLAPSPCVYRKRALDALDAAGRRWRLAYASPSLAGQLAAVRAGLGASVLPREMVPQGIQLLGAAQGLPDLADMEIAVLHRSDASAPVRRLAEHIQRSLELRDDASVG